MWPRLGLDGRWTRRCWIYFRVSETAQPEREDLVSTIGNLLPYDFLLFFTRLQGASPVLAKR